MTQSSETDLAGVRRRTPLHQWHLARGAHFVGSGGWHIVERYTEVQREVAAARAGVGISDISAHAKQSLIGPGVAAVAEQLAPGSAATKIHGVGSLRDDGASLACRLAQDQLLILAGGTARLAGRPSFDRVIQAQAVLSVDVTSAYAEFLLIGPAADDLLRQLVSLDIGPRSLPAGTCTQTSLAGVYAMIIRRPGTAAAPVALGISCDLAEYVWDCLWQAGRSCGVSAVGQQALQSLIAPRPG